MPEAIHSFYDGARGGGTLLFGTTRATVGGLSCFWDLFLQWLGVTRASNPRFFVV